MRLGLFLIMPAPAGSAPGSVVERALADGARAEELGFDAVWVTEHHGSDYGWCSAPSVMAGALAVRTRRVDIGYAVNVTPLHHPVRLAEEIATVDQLSRGRVIAGFGPGYSPVEYAPFDADFDDRHRLHDEGIRRVVEHWRTTDGIRPVQAHPRVAVTAGSPEAAARAGRRGYDLLALSGGEQLRELIRAYRDQSAGTGRIGVLRLVAITRDGAPDREVLDAARWTLSRRNRLVGLPEPDDDQVAAYLAERAIVGTPRALSRHMAELASNGVDELICWCRWGTIDDTRTAQTMEYLTKNVRSAK
ncbi:MAG: LLM class flavin-dependent oxidoreductase [Spirochaetaceae bacterium]|nr:LLM class flavin-dependent oxidoreductase [Spirochaetaceae bacterium]